MLPSPRLGGGYKNSQPPKSLPNHRSQSERQGKGKGVVHLTVSFPSIRSLSFTDERVMMLQSYRPLPQ